MKAEQSRVTDVFKKFDTDGSGALDASEFYGALIELGLPEQLRMPEDDIGRVLHEVFDTMDSDGNGVLSFQEINKYLRSGRHEVQLDEKLQPGAVAVPDATQAHRTRRKEEWKALDRFRAMDVDGNGSASMRELLAFFLSEGYSEGFVKGLMDALDLDADGNVSAEEWRAGVSVLRNSSLLMSMTDPVAPPSGEKFVDLLSAIDYTSGVPAPYNRKQERTTVYPTFETATAKRPSRGCKIESAEERGIKLSQVRAVTVHVNRRLHEENWVDPDGNRLTEAVVNMYDLAAYVVKPACKKKRCSLVELMAKAAQPPKWFVSHWWGTPWADTHHCLEQHARDRRLELNGTVYWVSAFALSQWQLSSTIAVDQSESVFYRAMERCEGTIAVIDRSGEYYSRTWCMYEAGLAISRSDHGAYLYEMYIAHPHKVAGELLPMHDDDDEGGDPSACRFALGYAPPVAGVKPPPTCLEQRYAVGITEGLVALDRDGRCKTVREAHFPSTALQHALGTKLQSGTCTVDADKTRILNSLAGTGDLEAKPPFSHAAYTELNAAIRGRASTASLVRGVVEHANGDATMFEALLVGLQESTLTYLDVSFGQAIAAGVNVPFTVFDRILSSLPPTIEHVRIQLPASIKKLPEGKLKELRHLHVVDLQGSAALDRLPADLTECYELQTLDLSYLTQLPEVTNKLFDLRSLTTLNLTGCTSIKTLNARGLTRSKLECLILEDCSGLLELPEALGTNLSCLNSLNLKGCDKMQRLPKWVAELENSGGAIIRPSHLM